jgi:hypothetical protein
VDPFLRRVLTQREREQGVGAEVSSSEAVATGADPFRLGDAERRAWLDRVVGDIDRRKCRVCGRSGVFNARDDFDNGTSAPLTVCIKCGGRRRHRQLEAEDAEVARKRAARAELLRLGGFESLTTSSMAANDNGGGITMATSTAASDKAHERLCTGCHKPLRASSVGDKCFKCRMKSGELPPETSNSGGRPPSTNVRKQFRVLATAMGFNPEGLIDRFCKGWIENLREKAGAPVEEDT